MTPEPAVDGSVTATGRVASDVIDREALRALVTSWPEKGTVLDGVPFNGEIKWHVDTVVCEA